MSEPALDPPEATQAAVAAAAAAGVVVRELHQPGQLLAVQRLFEEVWRPAEGDPPPVTAGLLRALAHSGAYVVGAFAGTRMVGASAGFFTAPPDAVLHSHITGVAPGGEHRGIGFALKVHQRAWALARGVPEVVWTFDPPVAGACAGRPRQPAPGPAEAALAVGPDLEPVAADTDASAVTVALPPDVEGLAPERRRAWRAAVRQALGGRLAAGATVAGFLRHPDRYLVQRPDRDPAGRAGTGGRT